MRTKILLCLGILFFHGLSLVAQDDEQRRERGRKPPPAQQQQAPQQPPTNIPAVSLTGIVKDADTGEGLLGAAVMVEDKATGQVISGVYADEDGKFLLKYTPNGNAMMLKVQYIGMKTYTADIGNLTNFDIVMESDAIGIEEVVITALNVKQKKADLGYVVQEVKMDQILRSNEQNIVQSLAGKVAGVQVISSAGVPGASSTIIIRGQSSITGNNEALFVVDGVPIDNQTRLGGLYADGENNRLFSVAMSNRALDLNPDDIESVTVLKGPAAAALYGTRAGAGTVVITTKKGSRGSGTTVNYRTGLEISEVNRLPELNRKFAQGFGGNYNPGTARSWGGLIDTTFVGGQRLQSYDNAGNFFQLGTTINNTVALTHATDKSAVRFSIGNSSMTGIVPNTDYRRTSVRMSVDTDVTNKLKVLLTGNFVNSGGTRAQQGSNFAGVMLSLLRSPASYDLRGGSNPSKTETKGYLNPDFSQRSYIDFIDNPYFTAYRNTFQDNVNRMMSTATITYTPTHWLEVLYRAGLDFFSDRQKEIIDYASYNPTRIIENQYFHRELYGDLLITAKKQFNSNWRGSITLGNNLNERFTQRLNAQGLNLTMPSHLNPGYSNLSQAMDIKAFEDRTTIRIFSIFAYGKIQYKDVLTIQATGRSETSSTFGPNNKTFFYPSVNTAFVFTELQSYKDSKLANVLSFGKIRLAYSIVGIEPLPYKTRTYFTQPSIADGWISPGYQFPFNGRAGFSFSDVNGNLNLRPERVDGFEVGTDLRFFGNKVGIDFTYYHEVTTSAIFNIPVSNSSGYKEYVGNSGQLTNKGFEIVLNGNIEKKTQWGRFAWLPLINFTRNRSYLDKLAPGLPNFALGGFAGSDIRAVEGQPYGQIFGSAFETTADGKTVVDENGYPILAATDQVLGNIQPKFLMGFGSDFVFNDLVISFLVDWKNGGDIWNGTRGTLNVYGTSRETEDRGSTMIYPNSVTREGLPNTTPMVKNQGWYTGLGGGFTGAQSQFVEDGSWVRLREISIAYSIHKLKLWKHIHRINLTLSGRNLLLITNYKGVDPETNLTGAGSNAMGMDYYNMPNTRSIMFAIDFTFK